MASSTRIPPAEGSRSAAASFHQSIIFGGQGTNIALANAGACFECNEAGVFEVNVSIQNLLPQELGTSNAINQASDVFVFFTSEPTEGVTIANSDTTGTFTESGQQAFKYTPPDHFRAETSTFWLDVNETSGPKTWKFDVPGGVTSFSFQVLIKGEVPYPDGFVDISPDPAAAEVGGGTVQLTATAMDAFGEEIQEARSFTWSSSDVSLATVDSDGFVTAGSDNRTVTITASSDGPEADGSGLVKVYEELTDRTLVIISDNSGGELNYRFVVSTASSSSLLGVGIDSTETTTESNIGGADLYVRFGSPPSTTVYDCRPFRAGSRESCTADDPSDGDWFAMVRAGSDYTDVSLIADLEISAPGYTSEVRYVSTLTGSQQTAVENAMARWESVITGDLRPYSVLGTKCVGNEETFRVNRVVDDMVILVAVEAIDGPGGVLANAGPCVLRSTTESAHLPPSGIVALDVDDLTDMENNGTLETVLAHEIGHAIGFAPSVWNQFGLVSGSGTSDPRFTGAEATTAYQSAGAPGEDDVPLQSGSPAAEAHWRESVLDTELMTPALDGAGDELSAITAGAMADVGYGVDSNAADPYTLPGGSMLVEPSATWLGNDILPGPVFTHDEEGRLIELPERR